MFPFIQNLIKNMLFQFPNHFLKCEIVTQDITSTTILEYCIYQYRLPPAENLSRTQQLVAQHVQTLSVFLFLLEEDQMLSGFPTTNIFGKMLSML